MIMSIVDRDRFFADTFQGIIPFSAMNSVFWTMTVAREIVCPIR
jgi:hypothetical protein